MPRSSAFNIARLLALVKRSAGLDDFKETNLWDATIRDVMEKVNAKLDPEITAAYPKEWGAKVTVVLKNGQTIEKQTDFPKGDPENPVTSEDLRAKFIKLATSLTEEQRQVFADRVLAIDSIANVADLMAELIECPIYIERELRMETNNIERSKMKELIASKLDGLSIKQLEEVDFLLSTYTELSEPEQIDGAIDAFVW